MKSVIKRVSIDTPSDTAMMDVTDQVNRIVSESGVREGVAFVTSLHTTAGITVNEGLPDVEADVIGMLKRLAPTDDPSYLHNRWLPSDGSMAINSATHQRAALVGAQIAFPVSDNTLVTGARHRIYFVELDGPLRRSYMVHVMGE